MAYVRKSVRRRRLERQNVVLKHARKKEWTQEHIIENTKAGRYTEQVSEGAQDANVSLRQREYTAHAVEERSDENLGGTTAITDTKTGGRTGKGKGKGKESSEEERYSFNFQCFHCLAMHQGVVQSTDQLLEIECDNLIRWNHEAVAPDLFYLLGKPRRCGRVNHVYGRRLKK